MAMREAELTDLFRVCHDVELHRCAFDEICGALASLLDVSHALLVSETSNMAIPIASSGVSTDFIVKFQKFSKEIPWMLHQDKHQCEAYNCANIIPAWELVRGEFYRDWLRPQNLLHGLIGIISISDAETLYVLALRSSELLAFSARDVECMRHTLSPVRSAIETWRLTGSLENRIGTLEDILDRLPQALFVVNRDCDLIFYNAAARALLRQTGSLRLIGRRLCLVDAHGEQRLQQRVREVGTRQGISVETLLVHRPRKEAVPLILALTAGSDTSNVIISVYDFRQPQQHLLDTQLTQLLGFTPAEAHLVSLLLDRKNLKDAAELLHISMNTARTHMKRIYSKANVHSQSDLQYLLTLNLADNAPHENVRQRHPLG